MTCVPITCSPQMLNEPNKMTQWHQFHLNLRTWGSQHRIRILEVLLRIPRDHLWVFSTMINLRWGLVKIKDMQWFRGRMIAVPKQHSTPHHPALTISNRTPYYQKYPAQDPTSYRLKNKTEWKKLTEILSIVLPSLGDLQEKITLVTWLTINTKL